MATRGYGTGTFTRRGKSWRGQFVIDGERVSITRRTKQEVVEAAAELVAQSSKGLRVKKNNITVEELFDIYFEKSLSKRISEQTAIRYKAQFENHIFPYLGDVLIQDLTKPMLEEAYAKEFKAEKYSHSTVNSLSSNFKRMLKWAVQNDLLARNPHDGVELHKLRPPKKVSAYSLEEHKIIVEFCKKNRLDWLYYFLISTGARVGESVALTWDDIDFKNCTVRINKTSVELHGNAHIQERTKTKAGTRTIVVSPSLIEFLKMVKASQNQELNLHNLVFPNTRYHIINLANARLRWIGDCEKMGIPYKGVHALRHTWATRALEAGVDIKTVSRMLGHKNVITTMNIYQDVLPDQQRSAVNKIDDILK